MCASACARGKRDDGDGVRARERASEGPEEKSERPSLIDSFLADGGCSATTTTATTTATT
jgi:hypothetical protein